ncbi:MAG: integrase arm-type DNA-binding domain-containing protein, partial [Pseudomonadota bacterium]
MLTDLQCRNAKPGEKEIKLFDQHGLYLSVRPTGYKSWKMKTRFGGKVIKLTFGPYPEVKITEAREKMWAARGRIRDGVDPRRKEAVTKTLSFQAAARQWLALKKDSWRPKHYIEVKRRIEDNLIPAIGPLPVSKIKPKELLKVLTTVQDRGAIEVAHRLRGYASNIFEMAIAQGEAEIDPAASIAKALKPKRSRKYPAIVEIDRCRAFLRRFEAQPAFPGVKLASRLMALTAARSNNVRLAQAHEFEMLGTPEAVWRIPASKLKLPLAESQSEEFDFVVPLARQTQELIKLAIREAGEKPYLFSSIRYSHRPLSDMAISKPYGVVPGFEGRHVPHGWRSSFSSIMNQRAADEGRQGEREIIDLMLAHRPAGVEATYNR